MAGMAWRAPWGRIPILLLTAVLIFRIAAAAWTAGDTELTVWGDRDLWRALDAWSSWPAFGPEINGGVRPPGGALYLLLGAILAVHPAVLTANLGLIALFAGSLALVAIVIGRGESPRAGLLAAVLLAGSPLLGGVLRVWNPGFVLFFATAATLAGYAALRGGSALALGLGAAALAVGLQIHLQCFPLLIGLGLAFACCRPRLTLRHGLAVLAGFAVPFLPALAGGGFHMAAATAPVATGAAENYFFWEFHPLDKLVLAYGLLGGSIDFTDPAAVLPAIGDLLAGLLALGFLAWAAVLAFRRRPARAEIRAWSLFPLVAAVFLVETAVSSVLARHLVAALPSVAIMGGLAADRLLTRAAGRRPLRLAAGLGILLLALRPVAQGAWLLLPHDFALGSVPAQAEIAALAKAAFTPDGEDFEARAALFQRQDGRSWLLMQEGTTGQMSFVYRTTPAAAGIEAQPAATDGSCLAVLRKEGAGGDPRTQLAASPAFLGLAPTVSAPVAESAHFLFLPYRTADGNCLKSFPNAYIPTRYETAELPAGGGPTARATADGARFAVRLPGQAFPIGIELRRSGADYRAVLQGRLLRGYTGLHFATIVNPVLCLDDGARTRTVALGRGGIGSPQRGTLAPWQSAPFALPDGTYRLWLVGRDGKSPQAVRLALGRLTVPGNAALPAGPDDGAPPAGCPVPAVATSGGAG